MWARAQPDTSKPERRLRTTRLDALDVERDRYVVSSEQAPQRWGYNLVRLYPEAGSSEVTVTFRGVVQTAAHSDFRWGLVATDAALTKARYSALQRGTEGALTFCVTAGEPLFLMVMGTPSVQQHIEWDQLYPTLYRYPYMVQLAHAKPEGFQAGAANPFEQGKRWSNGGGWVAMGANVADGAYVGPYAAVLSGTVGASARIEGHATILGGTVSSGTVGGLTILLSGASVSGSARVEVAWPYGPARGGYPSTVRLAGLSSNRRARPAHRACERCKAEGLRVAKWQCRGAEWPPHANNRGCGGSTPSRGGLRYVSSVYI